VIIFGSVRFLSKKVTKPKFFFLKKKPKPNRNRVKPTGFGSVRFFRAKTGSNRFGSVFSVLARFFPVLARFFSVWLCFFGLARFFSGFLSVSVRFGSVFLVIKPKPNRTGRFFQKFNRFNRFFFSIRFFRLFFFRFSWFNRFSGFFLTPTHYCSNKWNTKAFEQSPEPGGQVVFKKEREPTGLLVKTGKHNIANERLKKKTFVIVQEKVRIKENAYLVNIDR